MDILQYPAQPGNIFCCPKLAAFIFCGLGVTIRCLCSCRPASSGCQPSSGRLPPAATQRRWRPGGRRRSRGRRWRRQSKGRGGRWQPKANRPRRRQLRRTRRRSSSSDGRYWLKFHRQISTPSLFLPSLFSECSSTVRPGWLHKTLTNPVALLRVAGRRSRAGGAAAAAATGAVGEISWENICTPSPFFLTTVELIHFSKPVAPSISISTGEGTARRVQPRAAGIPG